MSKSRQRALAWSKEVERRARDLYQQLWPSTERTKRNGVESYEGCPDLVGLPVHVQVKARSRSAIASMYEAADRVRREKGTGSHTHLVTQSERGPILVTMRLSDYVETVKQWQER